MSIVGLTGGIGSGKSTVSAILGELGLDVVDADAITHDLQQPGQPTLAAMVAAFGPSILHDDGTLDRAEMARQAFPDPEKLARLNAIVHPAVGAEIAARLDALKGTDMPVILDVPLLVESGRGDLAELIVVDIDPELAIERLMAHRSFDEQDARARISRQASRESRLASATITIDNNGTMADLERQVHHVHQQLIARAW